jgi:hypothetical protein
MTAINPSRAGVCFIGLFFCVGPRSHTDMDESLERIIRRALDDARATGRDFLTQTEMAVRAVRQVRPDLTASEILATVRRLQQS